MLASIAIMYLPKEANISIATNIDIEQRQMKFLLYRVEKNNTGFFATYL